jgi:hypothetical protein
VSAPDPQDQSSSNHEFTSNISHQKSTIVLNHSIRHQPIHSANAFSRVAKTFMVCISYAPLQNTNICFGSPVSTPQHRCALQPSLTLSAILLRISISNQRWLDEFDFQAALPLVKKEHLTSECRGTFFHLGPCKDRNVSLMLCYASRCLKALLLTTNDLYCLEKRTYVV